MSEVSATCASSSRQSRRVSAIVGTTGIERTVKMEQDILRVWWTQPQQVSIVVQRRDHLRKTMLGGISLVGIDRRLLSAIMLQY
jgi:hypothetical protein